MIDVVEALRQIRATENASPQIDPVEALRQIRTAAAASSSQESPGMIARGLGAFSRGVDAVNQVIENPIDRFIKGGTDVVKAIPSIPGSIASIPSAVVAGAQRLQEDPISAVGEGAQKVADFAVGMGGPAMQKFATGQPVTFGDVAESAGQIAVSELIPRIAVGATGAAVRWGSKRFPGAGVALIEAAIPEAQAIATQMRPPKDFIDAAYAKTTAVGVPPIWVGNFREAARAIRREERKLGPASTRPLAKLTAGQYLVDSRAGWTPDKLKAELHRLGARLGGITGDEGLARIADDQARSLYAALYKDIERAKVAHPRTAAIPPGREWVGGQWVDTPGVPAKYGPADIVMRDAGAIEPQTPLGPRLQMEQQGLVPGRSDLPTVPGGEVAPREAPQWTHPEQPQAAAAGTEPGAPTIEMESRPTPGTPARPKFYADTQASQEWAQSLKEAQRLARRAHGADELLDIINTKGKGKAGALYDTFDANAIVKEIDRYIDKAANVGAKRHKRAQRFVGSFDPGELEAARQHLITIGKDLSAVPLKRGASHGSGTYIFRTLFGVAAGKALGHPFLGPVLSNAFPEAVSRMVLTESGRKAIKAAARWDPKLGPAFERTVAAAERAQAAPPKPPSHTNDPAFKAVTH